MKAHIHPSGVLSLKHLLKSLKDRGAGFWDQVTFSAATLLQTALVIRFVEKEDFGRYAVVMSISIVAQSLMRSVVFIPYLVSSDPEKGTTTEWIDATARLLFALSPLSLFLVAVQEIIGPSMPVGFMLCAAFFVMCSMYYDVNRKLAFAINETTAVIISSTLIMTLWSLFGFMCYSGVIGLTAVIALNGLAVLCSAFFLHSIHKRRGLNAKRRGIIELNRSNMRNVAWNVSAFLPYSVYNNMAPLIIMLIYGPSMVAVFSASRILLAPITMLGSAIDNIDKVKAGRALRTSGIQGLISSLKSYLVVFGGLSAPYLLLAWFWCGDALSLVVGEQFRAHTVEGRIWLIVGLVLIFAQPLETGLVLLRKSSAYFWSRAAGAVVTILALLVGQGLDVPVPNLAVALGWTVSTVLGAIILRVVYWRMRNDHRQ